MTVRVVLEVAGRRSFASALDWPGWARSGKSPDEALERLVAYGPRYAKVARHAKVPFTAPASVDELEVVERRRGGGGTEFGVPGSPAVVEGSPLAGDDLKRLVALLRASWAVFDAAARSVKGKTLTTGPRGGGRTREKMMGHVRDADVAYLGQLGSRAPSADDEPATQPMRRLRAAFVEALRAIGRGEEPASPSRVRTRWSPRYAIRRSAWHALDHAWELEDRSPR